MDSVELLAKYNEKLEMAQHRMCHLQTKLDKSHCNEKKSYTSTSKYIHTINRKYVTQLPLSRWVDQKLEFNQLLSIGSTKYNDVDRMIKSCTSVGFTI